MRHSVQKIPLGIPRRVFLRWLSIYFIVFSLLLITWAILLLGRYDGALSGFAGALLGVTFLVGLINFGLGSLGLFLSFWGRRGQSKAATLMVNSPSQPSSHSPKKWSSNRELRFLYQASLGLISATVLYGLVGYGSMMGIVYVAQNGMGWWYSLRMPQVKVGDSRQRVEQIVGQGSFRAKCGDRPSKNSDQATQVGDCASVQVYYSNLRERWEITYNAEDQVISKQQVKLDEIPD